MAALAGVETIGPFSLRELYWRAESLFDRQADLVAWLSFHQPWHSEPDYESLHPILSVDKRERDETFEARETEFRASLPKEVTDAEAELSWLDFQATFH